MTDARIERYLAESSFSPSVVTVLPLTGDASDRKYFRVIFKDGRTIVLALHVGAIDVSTLPFANVCGLLQKVPLPVPAILGHSNELGILDVAPDTVFLTHVHADHIGWNHLFESVPFVAHRESIALSEERGRPLPPHVHGRKRDRHRLRGGVRALRGLCGRVGQSRRLSCMNARRARG